MKVAVLGLGLSGQSAARFLQHRGHTVLGIDDSVTELSGGICTILPADFSVSDVELLVVSPGIPPTHPVYRKALQAGLPLIGEAELGLKEAKCSLVGITGTNGKTTTTLLITHILSKCGFSAHAMGNVGLPVTEVIDTLGDKEIGVVELSSFQLETMHTRLFDCSVILNITPDHLDRHGTLARYAKAKCRLATLTKGACYVEESTKKEYRSYWPESVRSFGFSTGSTVTTDGHWVVYDKTALFELPEKFRGRCSHHTENLLAAFAICRELGVASLDFKLALESFEPPEHRMERVGEFDRVTYINDSKGTNPHAVIRAVESLDTPLVLIAGGSIKQSSFDPWRQAFKGRVRHVIAMGPAAQVIEATLKEKISVQKVSSLKEAILEAKKVAEPGHTILLSPGCASFNEFQNYAHRGNVFKEMVRS